MRSDADDFALLYPDPVVLEGQREVIRASLRALLTATPRASDETLLTSLCAPYCCMEVSEYAITVSSRADEVRAEKIANSPLLTVHQKIAYGQTYDDEDQADLLRAIADEREQLLALIHEVRAAH